MMIAASNVLFSLVSILPLIIDGTAVPSLNYTIEINRERYLHEARKDFLSIALDCSLIDSEWQTFNPLNKNVIVMAKALSPAILRLGGTACDYVIFNNTNNQHSLFHLNTMLKNESLKSILYVKDWDKLVALSRMANLTLLFDANVMLRDPQGNWNSTNFISFLKHNEYYNVSNLMFELGNEPNNYPAHFNLTISASQLAADFKTLRDIISQHSFFKNSLIVGADVGNPYIRNELQLDPATYIHDFFEDAHSTIDALTWHQYYLKGSTAKVTDFINATVMETFRKQVIIVSKIIQDVLGANQTFPVWMGETSSAYDSGAKNISNRYVAGFLWMDKLGISAQYGYDIVIRQALYGGAYSLIDENMQPLPDFWLSYLFKKLVGRRSLEVSVTQNPGNIRVYASCSRIEEGVKPGAVTIYAMNLDPTSSARLQVTFNSTGTIYLLEPTDGTLTSPYVNINSQTMKLTNDSEIPPIPLKSQDYFELKPLTFGFFVLNEAKAVACI